jgi:hypothetical protein
MAVVQFAPGAGAVGRSIFHLLREFRHMHELSWPLESMCGKSRDQRMRAIMDQRANSVADLAAALGGAGTKSKMWTSAEERSAHEVRRTEWAAQRAKWEEEHAAWEVREKERMKLVEEYEEKKKEKRGLFSRGPKLPPAQEPEPVAPAPLDLPMQRVTIWWATEQDPMFARSWTGNVSHRKLRDLEGDDASEGARRRWFANVRGREKVWEARQGIAKAPEFGDAQALDSIEEAAQPKEASPA